MTQTEWIISLDDDLKDHDELFVGNVRDGDILTRCKDCRFATITDGVYGKNPEVKYCDIWFPSEAEYMPIDYYCASAERKEE